MRPQEYIEESVDLMVRANAWGGSSRTQEFTERKVGASLTKWEEMGQRKAG